MTAPPHLILSVIAASRRWRAKIGRAIPADHDDREHCGTGNSCASLKLSRPQ